MKDFIIQYKWGYPKTMAPLAIEMDAIKRGGRWKKMNGDYAGEGLEYHFRKGMSLCWPGLVFHKWLDDFIHEYLQHRLIGLMGSASTAKSHDAAIVGLFDYMCFPYETTAIYCSTTRELLRQRIFGEVVGLHKRAKKIHNWLPGKLIESRDRIVTSDIDEESEGRDFRNGLLGVALKSGESWIGLSSFVGIKNKRVRLFIDECGVIRVPVGDAIANLDANKDFKCVPIANPRDITDEFGKICEPSGELGGWDGGIDQQLYSKTFATKRADGVVCQRVGTDSPNLDGNMGIPLMDQGFIDRQVSFYGKESLQYTMMCLGIMPRGQGYRRVLTKQTIEQHGATNQPIWLNSSRKKLASLDAAYGGVGGDRCILKFGEFGEEMNGPAIEADGTLNMDGFVHQPSPDKLKRNIFAVTETLLVPIDRKISEEPEDQIAKYCMNECKKRGVSPECFFFDSGMRAKLIQAFMRLWSNKVQAIDSGGKPTERPVSYDIEMPCDKHYRKFITELWYSVRYVVLSNQFRGMTSGEIEEFSSREWGMVGNNLIEVEPKDMMKKKCFLAGTKVSTPSGDVEIENLKIGDFVLTPHGPSRIIKTHCNDSPESLCQLELSNGRTLTGTGTHEIFTWDKGWNTIDTLSLCSILEPVEFLPLWNLANALFTKTMSIGFKRSVAIIKETATSNTLNRRGFFTELSGLTTAGLFLKVGTSIISTVIGKITASATSLWLTLKNISQNTCGSVSKILSSESPALSFSQIGLLNLAFGIDPMRAESGTVKTPYGFGKTEKQPQQHAPNAERSFSVLSQGLNFVRTNASIKRPIEGIKKTLEYALFAARIISVIFIGRRQLVPRRVLVVSAGTGQKVYNLTLAEHNCYYANGILVANCGRSPDEADAVALLVEGARRMGFVIRRLKPIAEDEEDSVWKSEFTGKAKKFWSAGQMNYS